MRSLRQDTRGMVPLLTLIEMVICLAVVAVLLTAAIRAYGLLAALERRVDADDALLPQTQALIAELEAAPPQESTGALDAGWRYETRLEDGHYILSVHRADGSARYTYLLCQQEAD